MSKGIFCCPSFLFSVVLLGLPLIAGWECVGRCERVHALCEMLSVEDANYQDVLWLISGL
jgi:hypothetical protein